jgi:tRNA pseudouridine38-40 synthase
MVRRIVGVLAECGRGGLEVGQVAALLSGTSELPAKLTAPASGLFLEHVFYNEPMRPPELRPAVFVITT